MPNRSIAKRSKRSLLVPDPASGVVDEHQIPRVRHRLNPSASNYNTEVAPLVGDLANSHVPVEDRAIFLRVGNPP